MARISQLLALLSILLSVGCASMNTWGTRVPMGEKKYPSVPVEHVIILFDPPKKEYEQIGIVSSLGGVFASDGDMFKKMQKEAAALGADAIIVRSDGGTAVKGGDGITIVQSQKSGWEYPKTHAIAIKYK